MARLDCRRMRLLLAAAGVLCGLAVAPLPADAEIGGLCDAVGYPGGSATTIPAGQVTQLGTATRWSVPLGAPLTVEIVSSQPTRRVDAQAVFFGIGLPIAHWRGDAVKGSSGSWKLTGLTPISRVLGIRAQSDSCSGSVVLAVDESPLLTALGALGLLLAVGGAALVGWVAAGARADAGGVAAGRAPVGAFEPDLATSPATSPRAVAGLSRALAVAAMDVGESDDPEDDHAGARASLLRTVALGAGLGLVAGLGAGTFLQEAEVVSPLEGWALLFPLGGAVVGGASVAAAGAWRGSIPLRLDEQLRGLPLLAILSRLGLRSRGILAGALVGLLVTAGPTLAGVSAYRAPGLISPARAADVVRIYWNANNRAVTGVDPALRAPYETGALRQATLHHLQALKALGVKLQPQALRSLQVYVPEQTSFPGMFAASLETDQVNGNNQVQRQTWYLLFTRHDAHAPWLAAMIAIAPAGNHEARFALGSNGYLPAWTSSSTRPVLRPDRLSGAYASYVDQGLKTGQPSGPFASGPLTDQRVTALRSALQATASDLGVTTSLDFESTPEWYAFTGQDGSTIVFMNVADTFQVTSRPPHCLVQQRGGRFDPLLPDGKYRDVKQSSTDQFLAVESGRSVDVVGSSMQTQQATGDLGTGCA